MTQELIERSRKRHALAHVALIAIIVALIISLAIAAIVVSIGVARADALGHIAESDSGRYAVGVLMALIIAGMGGLTAVIVRDGEHPLRRD
jgi:hypothetical protein